MSAIESMRQVLYGLYKFMTDVRLDIFGVVCTLWDVYLYGLLAVIGVFIFLKIVRS